MAILLGDGNNTYGVSLGEVAVDGQGGEDRLIINYSAAGGPLVYENWWGPNYGILTDEAMNRVEFWNFESFDITGGADSDDLRGGNLGDRLVGGGGNDTLSSGLGADVIDGGGGTRDRWVVDYTGLAPADVAVSLLGGGTVFTVALTGAKVKNVESLFIDTGSGNDDINTSAVTGNDDIETREGDDLVTPGLGFDRVELGTGFDTLVLNYSTRTADMLHQDKGGGWFRYQDGQAPTTGIDYYIYNVERFNITGGAGNDNLSGRWDYDGNDRLIGNDGNDMLYGHGGIDTINGGLGTDTWIVNYDEVNANVIINVSSNTATVSTGATVSGIEQLIVDTYLGDDQITTRAGLYNDDIETRNGADSINPGRGIDVVNAGSYGEGNLLTLNWSAVQTNITHSYPGGGWYRFSSGDGDRVDFYGVDVFNITGGIGNDTLVAFGGADTLVGGDGNDWLNSDAGKATVNGGLGFDYWQANVSGILTGLAVNALESQTTAQGTAAGHSIRNVEGFRLITGSGNDTINGEGFAADDSVEAQDGNDSVSLGLGFDTANGGNGTDTLSVDYSSLTGSVNRVNDGGGWYGYQETLGTARITFYGFDKFNITGGSGGDDLYGGYDNDALVGNGGDDQLTGYGGRDTIDGGLGNDRWVGDYASLTGSIALTLTDTGTANMKVNGSAYTSLTSIENVTLSTGIGADVINLLGRAGNHTVNTGEGNDTVKLGAGQHNTNAAGGNDLLVVDFSTSTSAVRQVYQGGGWYLYYDTGEKNSVTHYGYEQVDITGGSSNDRLWGFGGDDKLVGGAGNDVLTGGGGNDALTGGAGNDLFVFESTGNGTDVISDAAAGDIIRVRGRAFSGSVVDGNGTTVLADRVQRAVDVDNNETILYIGSDGTPGADVVVRLQGIFDLGAFTLNGKDIQLTAGAVDPGTTGDDVLNGTAGNDELSGAAGNDKLSGKDGNDVLDGGTGLDTLIGGTGADTLIGGDGADRFQFATIYDSTPGTLYQDVVEDFLPGTDKLDLSRIDANPVVSGDQAFKYITSDFTGVAGQLRYDGTEGLVMADVNGDGMTDISIRLTGAPVIAAANFVL